MRIICTKAERLAVREAINHDFNILPAKHMSDLLKKIAIMFTFSEWEITDEQNKD